MKRGRWCGFSNLADILTVRLALPIISTFQRKRGAFALRVPLPLSRINHAAAGKIEMRCCVPNRMALFRSNVALSSKPRRQPDRIAA